MNDGELEPFVKNGKRLGIRFALVGSVLFAFVEVISVQINTHWIKHVDTPPTEIWWNLVLFILVSILGFCLVFIPARIGGIVLAHILYRVKKQHPLSPIRSALIGAGIGGVAGLMICLPIVVMNYLLVNTAGHGAPYVFIYRTGVVVVIASILGGLSGWRLSRQLQVVN